MTAPEIVLDVTFPHTDSTHWIPNSWLRDQQLSFTQIGLLTELLTYPDGCLISAAELDANRHPNDRPFSEHIDALVQAGYLVPDGTSGSRYRLVHPDRLPPLPPL